MSYRITRLLSFAVAFILVALPFHAFISTWALANFGHSDLFKAWKEMLILLIAPLAFLLTVKSPVLRKWCIDSWLVRLMVLFFALEVLMGAWALNAHKVSKEALANGLLINLRYFGFFFVCLAAAACGHFLYRNWRRLVILPASIVVAFGLAQHFLLPRDFLRHFGYGENTVQPYQTVDANLQYVRVQSTLRGANPLGAYLILVITAAANYWSRKKVLTSVALAGALVAMFYSYSRSAWLGVVLSVACFAWLNLQKAARYWLAGIFALILLTAAGIYGLKSNQTVQDIFFHHTVSSSSPDSSNEVRNSAIKNGLLDVIHEPLGRGPGTAGPASFRNDHPLRIAENYYIQIAQEAGIIGLLVFLGILVLAAKNLWDMRHELLPKVLLASLVGISFVNLVSHAWADDTLSLLWWGLAGIALGEGIRSTKGTAILAKKAKSL